MPDLTQLGRWMVYLGLAVAGVGGLIWLLGRAGLPLGQLPGDFRFQRGEVSCFIPLASGILLSLLLTLALNLILRLLRR